jgi:hypothetical protein
LHSCACRYEIFLALFSIASDFSARYFAGAIAVDEMGMPLRTLSRFKVGFGMPCGAPSRLRRTLTLAVLVPMELTLIVLPLILLGRPKLDGSNVDFQEPMTMTDDNNRRPSLRQ